ncbi:hypothetical protein EVJ50_03325 [Synechococcus sp. RSCCF101]|uniref:hypothetical protein n=1 Tax=Synechococcus sp. RSCCF101 TaxID=2511069 RepID=UPI001247D975|nr:hypothetical protein [Synechococcus sp. RSCCF101]QEY31425.1 hypothetical protein EVJ50_03325 [Synechococcus sp. RSCCF101]
MPLLPECSDAQTAASLGPQLLERMQESLSLLRSSPGWHGGLPVGVLDRCWRSLRLTSLDDLPAELPPDASGEAPELVRYRDCLERGLSRWRAELVCREEFGDEPWRWALRRYWTALDETRGRWTLASYLALRHRYRERFGSGPADRCCPVLILARPGSGDSHQLGWLPVRHRAIGHTCPH